MEIQILPLIIVVAYLVGMLTVGAVVSKVQIKNAKDYMVAGRRMGLFMVAFSLSANNIGGWAAAFFCISAAAPKPEPPPTSAQARSSATIFPALPPFFFCSGAGADGCGCAAAGCSKLYG